MNDVKLLPLPEPDWHDDNIRPASFDSYREHTLEEYARACVEADRKARKDQVARLREVVAFLCGVGQLEGRNFGDMYHDPLTGKLAPYWWRSRLRAAMEAAGGES